MKDRFYIDCLDENTATVWKKFFTLKCRKALDELAQGDRNFVDDFIYNDSVNGVYVSVFNRPPIDSLRILPVRDTCYFKIDVILNRNDEKHYFVLEEGIQQIVFNMKNISIKQLKTTLMAVLTHPEELCSSLKQG